MAAQVIEAKRDVARARIGIVGTGFSGLGLAIKLKEAGIDDFVVFERASDVGGTWRDNTYPGCQCDVPSHLYSFSFRLNPNWTRTYSPQPEIFDYLQETAREAGVLPHVRFEHAVVGAEWDADESVWRVKTSQGEWEVEVLISGNGGLAEPATPPLEGLDDFEGQVWHSGAWNKNSDLAGRKVAVIGTGASAIQIVPQIQPEVDKLFVYQRTPAWVLPHTDRPTRAWERKLYRRLPFLQKLIRLSIYCAREMLVIGLAKDRRFIEPLRRIALVHLKRSVPDRDLRRKLRPRYSPGCKRLLLSNNFYPALTKPNTELVTDGIQSITPSGIVSPDGTTREVDTIIFATGFRVTDNPVMSLITGRKGRSLSDLWAEKGSRAYLGTAVDEFPNLFMMTGPNTGIGHTSLLVMIEAQIKYIMKALRFMDQRNVRSIEVRQPVVEEFNQKLQSKMGRTVWTMGGCASWYLDSEGRNTTIWPDFTWKFRRLTSEFNPADYLTETAAPARTVEVAGARR